MTTEPQATGLDRDAITEGAVRILSGMVHKDPDTLGEQTRLFADLGLDSTNALELLMLIEDELHIAVDADTLEHRHLETVGSLSSYLAEQAGV